MKIPISKEGYNLIKLSLIFTIASYILGSLLYVFYFFAFCFLLFALFFIYFFRDPERKIISHPQHILSPADGKIISIEESETEKTVKIFMSPFDVHIQRAPCNCIVESIDYKKGKFHQAFRPDASVENEQNSVNLRLTAYGLRLTAYGLRLTIKQIAGVLVRRIVCWAKIGDHLTQGQRLGMIKFGSQVDLVLPKVVNQLVKCGDKVKAGISIIGEI